MMLEISMKYGGILGSISEASDIAKELGVSPEEAAKIQRERAALREQHREALAESNVIPFRAKH